MDGVTKSQRDIRKEKQKNKKVKDKYAYSSDEEESWGSALGKISSTGEKDMKMLNIKKDPKTDVITI